jgi:hypothetical protein
MDRFKAAEIILRRSKTLQLFSTSFFPSRIMPHTFAFSQSDC